MTEAIAERGIPERASRRQARRQDRVAGATLWVGVMLAVAVTAGVLGWSVTRRRRRSRKACGAADAFIARAVSEVFGFCRELKNLQSILSQWIMPPGSLPGEFGRATWRSEILEEQGGQLLVWQVTNDRFQYRGRMEFQPARYGLGTSVALLLQCMPPELLPQVDLQREAEESLRRLKVVLEARAVAEAVAEPDQVVPSAETRVAPTQGDVESWAPESGEPAEVQVGYGRGERSSVAGDDVGLAPESGERVVDERTQRGVPPEALPETGTIEERADEYRVAEGSEESFPASDVPSWAPGHT